MGDSSHKSSRSTAPPNPPSSPSPAVAVRSVVDSLKLKMLVLLDDSAKLSTDVDVYRFVFSAVLSLKLTKISWNWSTLIRGNGLSSTKNVSTGLLANTEFPHPKSSAGPSRCSLSIWLLSSTELPPKFRLLMLLVSWLAPADSAPGSDPKSVVESLNSLGFGGGGACGGWISELLMMDCVSGDTCVGGGIWSGAEVSRRDLDLLWSDEDWDEASKEEDELDL
ncbi:hypothetical protein OGAPHI_000751 [Ogataea philodendri]|uniref:Uncharacterized protein n=1 Tax=Ogataea philodendri TaxID=1378263 RepID=A0A9P8PG80_9ASCO|nr:uncharacterized protein OGAPHI_000751 [Ogataea philodendri]KAH3671040.1 hypothetical protein OGAPHI_000751 [Ogataea philodendri]